MILEYDQFIRSIEISKNDAFSVFLGAGASINSGILSANGCIWEWKRSLYATKGPGNLSDKLDFRSEQVRNTIQRWLDNEGIYPQLDDPTEYSFYVKQCYPIEEDVRKYFQKICERKHPSVGYKLLCFLNQTGLVKSIWTTNFDDLYRDAAIITGNNVIDISLDSVDRIFRPSNSNELQLIKLHGDYKYGKLKNTDEELSKQEPVFKEKLIDYLNDKHLIVSGYSGRDESIMSTLSQSYSKKGSGRLYWCGFGREIPDSVKKLLKLAEESGRTAYYVPTDGFDKLMRGISKLFIHSHKETYDTFEPFLKIESEVTNTPFSIELHHINAVLKSNLFPLRPPVEAFQFQIKYQDEERPWATLRKLCEAYELVAVPFENAVWALGTLSAINQCFAERIIGQVSRVPIASKDIVRISAFHQLMLSGFTRLLGLKHALDHNNKDMLWIHEHETAKMINDVLYRTHKGIRLSLVNDGYRFYISLMPDFHISASPDDTKVTKEIKQEVGRQYFDKIRNKEFNNYVNEWRTLFFNSHEKTIDFEFPSGSGTGLIYKISKNPIFSRIMNPLQTKWPIDPKNIQVPKHLIRFDGIQYPEPRLVFSNASNKADVPTDFHPMRGISKNRPYDFPMTNILFGDTIKIAVICPVPEGNLFSQFLHKHNTAVSSNNVNKAYLIDYPGFYEAFHCSLNIPEIDTENWVSCSEPKITESIKEIALDLKELIIDRINHLSRDRSDKVIVLCIPKRWVYYTSYDEENEAFDLHDYIKAYCAEKGIATQFIQEETVEDTHLSCQINWWLGLSYFVKSMRTPWVLENLDKETAFAGIGYSLTGKGDKSNITIGCSHIYNSKGQGLKYKLSKVEDEIFWDKQKSPHLSYNDAFNFGVSIRELFYSTMNELPKRVVIHKRTFYTDQELKGLQDSLIGNGIENVDLIEINFEDSMRFISSFVNREGKADVDGYAIKRGTCILLNTRTALLWTHGVVPSVLDPNQKYYLGGRYIPGPLKIIKHLGTSNIGTIANEVLALTKVNWNSFDLYSQLPATVSSSNSIARIGKLLTKREGITYDYRYFI